MVGVESGLGFSMEAACLATSFSKKRAANGDTGFPRCLSPTVQLLRLPFATPAQPAQSHLRVWLQGKLWEKPLSTPSIHGFGMIVSFFLAASAPST